MVTGGCRHVKAFQDGGNHAVEARHRDDFNGEIKTKLCERTLIGRGAKRLGLQELGHRLVDHLFIRALEIRPMPVANRFDHVRRNACDLRIGRVRGPGVFCRPVTHHDQNDQLKQTLLELAVFAQRESQPVSAVSKGRVPKPDSERSAHALACPNKLGV